MTMAKKIDWEAVLDRYNDKHGTDYGDILEVMTMEHVRLGTWAKVSAVLGVNHITLNLYANNTQRTFKSNTEKIKESINNVSKPKTKKYERELLPGMSTLLGEDIYLPVL